MASLRRHVTIYGEAEPDYGFTGQEKDHESGLHNFRARTFHEQLGRFFAVDPQGQFHSPYVYGGNNPLMFTDPDGELIWLVPILIGATMNVVQNWDHIKSQDNIWSQIGTGLGYAAVGGGSAALATFGGPIGWAVGGFMQGSLNAGMQGHGFGEAMLQGGIGAASGLAGGFAGQYASKLGMGIMVNKFAVTSPVLLGGVTGAIGGAAGYLATGDLSKAHDMGWASAKSGMAMGAGIGSASAYYAARQQGIDPRTGLSEKTQVLGREMSKVRSISDDVYAENIGNNSLLNGQEKPQNYFNDVTPNRILSSPEILQAPASKQGLRYNELYLQRINRTESPILHYSNPTNPSYSPYYHHLELNFMKTYPNTINLNHYNYKIFNTTFRFNFWK